MNRTLATAMRERLDPHFTRKLEEFSSALEKRSVLDHRTLVLVQVGQFTVTRSHSRLDEILRVALAEDLARDALEVILQCSVYTGDGVVGPALEAFTTLAQETGQLNSLGSGGVPAEGPGPRVLEEERRSWHPDDLNDARRQRLMDKYGWEGISTGLRLRPKHHLDILEYLDAIDEDFARHWLDFVYDGMYIRGVLDDRTRLLCLIGELSALGETTQLPQHMKVALRSGASPAEVKEVILQSSINFGMPYMLRAMALFVTVMREAGRLDEIGNPAAAVQ